MATSTTTTTITTTTTTTTTTNGIIPEFDKKSSPESIKLIMNSKEHHVNKLVMKFVSSCMKIRDSLLVMLENS